MKVPCALIVLSLPFASATLIAQTPGYYDGCRPDSGYSESSGGDGRLDGQKLSGPPGWAATWSLPKAGRSPLYLFREAAGLTYPAIAYPGGGGVQITPSDAAAQDIGRKLAQGIVSQGNAAIYASFLLSVSEKKPQGIAYVLFTGVGGLGAGISDGFLMVLARQDAGIGEDGMQKKEWMPLLSQEYQPNTTYFFVVKIGDGDDEWTAADEMEVWINPKDVSTQDEASSNALVYNIDSPGNIIAPSGFINQLLLHTENLEGITVKFDEFRVGTTWESVTGPIQP